LIFGKIEKTHLQQLLIPPPNLLALKQDADVVVKQVASSKMRGEDEVLESNFWKLLELCSFFYRPICFRAIGNQFFGRIFLVLLEML
jgi:hypothetical protein